MFASAMRYTSNHANDAAGFPQDAEASNGSIASVESLTYWSNRLAGLEPLELPRDPALRARAERGDPASDPMVRFALSRAQSESLKTLAADRHATLSMVLMAAFQTLLMRYSGQTDFAV
ncbi:MAG TPA: condensation domain-containing protein, partial [Burkholderiaceae bacterium]|nr:condensation domain-containing protein [Burkholderiaceae bacterium]